MAKQYGLIKADKSKVIQRPSIFNSDSDSDNEPEKPTGITVLKKKERMVQEKAIADDPTIYQYDELYDDMQSKRKESKLARKDLDKKPKYINKLLESAERRKRENERRIERQVQKEREEEGDMFKDKESFVTTAYRKKLEELKELEEKEKREDYLEAIGDVKKQSDLSGFYRHLYAQQVNSDDEDKSDESSKKTIENQPNTISTTTTTEDKSTELPQPRNVTKKRKYRKRETSKSDQSSDEEKPKLEHLPSNIDADSDFSIDSDSENSDQETDTKKIKQEVDPNLENATSTVDDKTNEPAKTTNDETEESKDIKQEVKEDVKPEVPKKPKIDIWKKRTVGPVFDEALRRFYERKSAKVQTVN